MSTHRKVWILIALAVVSLLGWIFYGLADPCANNPCQSQGDIEGLRCGIGCTYVSVEESERYAGRYCYGYDPACRTYSAGGCNHQLDVFCM